VSAEQQTPAIVVGGIDYGEADRIVRLLSPTLGRVSVLARAARRSNRRFTGALEAGNRITATVRPGRGDLWHLKAAKLEDGRLHARADLEVLSLLAYACEVCGELARPLHSEPRLFGLLDMALVLLDGVTAPPSPLFRLGLEAKALTFAGLTPTLDRCAICSEPATGGLAFDPAAGGVVHTECHRGPAVRAEWCEAVEAARRTPLRDLIDAPLPAGPPWALSDHIQWHLGRGLKSRSVLAAISLPRPAPPPAPVAADSDPPAQ
jgi:DNA repair protein RecO (recombination protein O)